MAYSCMPATYRPRIVDVQIERYLQLFGAVEVSGTKWCGKTWSSLAHANSVVYVDRGANLQICQADPSYALVGDDPHLIDEWQRVPRIWDTVRHAVDDLGGKKGQWILTGSSTPRKSEVAHSGAGRIGKIRMRPMTLQESGESTGNVSLEGLFGGSFKPSPCPNGITDLARGICRGGWPDLVDTSPEGSQIVVREYLDAIYERSIPELGGEPMIARRTMRSLARNMAQAVTTVTVAQDLFATDGKVPDTQQREAARYLDMFSRLYLVDEVRGWVPASRSPKRMRTRPKRYFADPSIPVAVLGLSEGSLLQDWQTLGMAFETLCVRDLDVYARAMPECTDRPLLYYHDDSDLEVDAIIERADGSWGAFEIKLSQDKVDAAAKNLLRLEAKLAKDPRGRVKSPSFLAVLTGMGEMAYQRPDGVYVIPIRALGA